MIKPPIVATTNVVCALLGSALLINCSAGPGTSTGPVADPSAPSCTVGAAADGSSDVTCPNGSVYHAQALPSSSSSSSGCTAKQLSNGVAITCSGKTVYLYNGADGKDGKNGKNGKDGKDGLDGKDGADGADGVDGQDGADGADGVDGKDGQDGKDGKDAPPPVPIAFFTEFPESGKLATSATLAFSSTLPDSTFECSLDGSAYASCTSPVALDALSAGPHTFSVKASAPDSPEGPAADVTWTIDRPNILFILADDLGYSDIHALGGEIDTPNLDALVANGRVLTNHHVGSVSAITRSMLISGTDHHLVGEGQMGVPPDAERKGKPGYEGYLNERALSVAQLLNDGGYHTYLSGKWHLGTSIPGGDPSVGFAPDHWGFERTYALLGGGSANHFLHENAGAKNFTADGVYVQPGQPGQPGGFSTELYTNQMLSFIDSNHGDGKPFFAYMAYTAPHWPLAAPEPWLSRYKGHYDQGYDPIRAARIERMKSLNVIPNALTPSPGMPENLVRIPATANDGTADAKSISAVHPASDGYVDHPSGAVIKNWSSLTDLERKTQARYMEVYAAMVENMDYHIGRLVQHLQDIGEYEKTLIVFHSDNGAEGWPTDSGADPKTTDEANAQPGVYELLGTDNGLQAAKQMKYGIRWAEVSAAPFSQLKEEVGEGGISTAAIVHLPGQIGSLPNIGWFSHITDDTATFLAAGGVTPPTTPAPPNIDPTTGLDTNAGKVLYNGKAVYPVTGISLWSALNQFAPSPVHTQPIGDEAYGRACIFSGDGQWKARWTEPPYGPADGHWELFYIVNDRGETTDLSAQYPTVAADLFSQWNAYMTSVGGIEPLRTIGFW